MPKPKKPIPGHRPAAAQVLPAAPAASAAAEHARFLPLAALLGVMGFAFALYAITIPFKYTLDDPISTISNQYVKAGISGISTLFTHGYMYGVNGINVGAYRPLPLVMFALEHQLFGASPQVAHFINVLLYALTAGVLLVVLRRLLPAWPLIVPLGATLLFIAHPIHTEVVASIKSRDEILAFLFVLLSLDQLLRHLEKPKALRLFLIPFWFLLGLLSKENAITFVAIVPVLLYFFRSLQPRQILLLALPFLLTAGLYLGLRAAFLDSADTMHARDIINNSLYAAKSTGEKYATGMYIMLRYVGLLFFPHPLSYDYSYNQIPVIGWSDVRSFLSVLVYGGLVTWAAVAIKKKHVLSFCVLWFIITMSIVSNLIVDIGSTMGERFLYVPSLAFCLALAWVLWRLFMRPSADGRQANPQLLAGVLGVLLLLYSAKTVSRSLDWKDNKALFESGVKTAPNSSRTNFFLGYEYFADAGRTTDPAEQEAFYRKAIVHMNDAIKIYPQYVDAWRNLGLMYYNLHEYDNAIKVMKHSMTMNDTLLGANYYTGLSYGYSNKPDSGLIYLNRAIQIKPDYAQAYHFKGMLLSELADKQPDQQQRAQLLADAVAQFDKALQLHPGFADSHFQRAYVYGKQGLFEKATNELEYGLKLNATDPVPWMYLGLGYGLRGMQDKAIESFRKAINLKPDYTEAYLNLTFALKQQGKPAEALQAAEQGLQTAPQHPQLQVLVQELRAQAGR